LQTVSIGVGVNGQWGPISWHGSGGLVLDTHGNLGGWVTYGAGPGAGAGGGIGGTLSGSNACTIFDLEGLFANGSVSAGEGLGASVDGFSGTSPITGAPVAGGGFTAGVGIGGGASSMPTNTKVVPIVDLW
jgi:hypothetical protein